MKGPKTIEDEALTILRTRNYSILIKDAITGVIEQITYNLEVDDLPLFRTPPEEDEDKRNQRVMKNKAHFQTSIRKLTESTFFFPTKDLYRLICLKDLKGSSEMYGCGIEQLADYQQQPSINTNEGSFSMKVKSAPSMTNHPDIKVLYVTDIKQANGFVDTQCSLNVSLFRLHTVL